MERLHKIARLALSPTASEGEQSAAAEAFFRILRQQGYTEIPWPREPEDKGLRHVKFSFGMYKGRVIYEVIAEDPGYGKYILEKFKTMSPLQRSAIQDALNVLHPEY